MSLLITRAPHPGADGVEWMARHQDEVRAALLRHGAILLRGFALAGAPAFTALARHLSPVLRTGYGDLAAEDPGAGVYRTTAYPEQHAIQVHNEGAHAPNAPLYLFFLNQSAPAQGGATRLVQTRRVLAEIDPMVRRRLRDVPLTYGRTHHPGVDVSWQTLYGTDDPRQAEQRCCEAGVAFRWLRRDTLQTSVTLPGLTAHPVTGEAVLFHQLFLFHPACLDADTRAGLEAIYAPDELPRSVRWASGEPIDDAMVRDLLALYEKYAVDVRWQPGDALIVDNALSAHGREPFTGQRTLLVAMGGRVHNEPRRPAPAPRRAGPDPAAPLPRADHDPVPVQFRRATARAPQATALEREDQAWTYRELERRAAQTAAALRALDLPRGAVVGVTGPRSFEVVAALLGVWMNGQVVVPLDADLPPARQQLMLAEAGAVAVLFAGEEPVWFAGGARIDLGAPLAVPTPGFQPVDLRPEDPAYVFFTSGSTGRPKGITGTHVGLAHFLDWQRTTFRVAPGDRIAQLTGLSFDVVLRDLFLALTSGATVCLPPASLNLADPWAWFRRARITRLHAVPSLASVWLGESARPACATLTTVFFAGEPLGDALVRRMRAATNAEIVNLYGPTETTLAKCAFRVGEQIEKGVQPIGYPLPGAMVLILDEQGGLCADGESGEIVIRTPYRTLGYLRREAGAGSRFAANPFAAATDDLVYYTGDLGRVRPDGALDILGRKDDQLKVMGVRIEPQEVSAALLSHPQVRQAFVTALPGPVPSLVAYVVADERLAPAGVLRAFLSEHLPAALVPPRFVHLASLPLNRSGKIDRQALPQPGAEPGAAAPRPVQPESSIDTRLAALFIDLLRLEAVRPSDDFFDCGGHSLLAMQLVSRVRDSFGVALEIQHVFEFPTLAALSRCVAELSPIARRDGEAVAPAIDRRVPQPLSFAQQRLWFFAKLVPEQGVYNIPGALRFRRGADLAVLQRCIDALVARHPSLRTCFVERDGVAAQRIDPAARWAVERRDVSALPPEQRRAAVRELARGLTRQPFRLDAAPLARAVLIRESESDAVLVYALNHGIADGWSNFVFSRELVQLYAAALAGADASLPALPFDTLDFAHDERERFADSGHREVEFWTAHLRGAPARLDLP
ncbi:MAG: amino acid adenylation domain-containing protein, partial [Candidatus Binatia bacterium]